MVTKVLNSFRYAINGLKITWREEHNFRIEVLIALVVLFFALFFNFSFIELISCIIAIIIVLTSEIVNTAIEDLSDMVDPNINPLIGKIKDTMAAFVLLCSLGAFAIGCLVFYHHFFVI